MVVLKRKKASRQRGKKTYGFGAKKKHRGSGNKGGRGHAGSGKRADSKKPSFWKDKDYFGRRGFNRKQSLRENHVSINLGSLDEKLDSFISSGVAKKNGNRYVIDLKKAGYTKLLGSGSLKHNYEITVESFSKKAKEKVEKAGGIIKIDENKIQTNVKSKAESKNGKETESTEE